MDQLRQVLDRVDVVMRWRRDELHPRLGMPQPRNEACHLEAGKLASLARLRTLRDLDLELVGALQVPGGDAETRGRDLLHLVVVSDSIAVFVRVGVLAPFAGVGPRPDLVHRDRQGFVCLWGERTE